MDFLDLCERAALYAQQEDELIERQQQAHSQSDDDEVQRIAKELESVAIEKRIALGLAINFDGA